MNCPVCDAGLPDAARFCPSCGSAVEIRGDERRVVTVLFGDVVGFTTLAEGRDPESVKNLIDHCFERLAADVRAFGGRVDKIVGDEIMALFGAPVAHEDDAERAVRSALRMQETVAAYAAETGAELRMRIGINTGEVLMGALRAGGDYTAMGDVVNTASRLQSQGLAGRALVGRATYETTRAVIAYEPLGPLQARGRGEPVEAWAATEALAPPGSRPRRSRSPLVGRKAELGMLWHAVGTAVEHRRPHLVLVVGDAGVGKTRLVEEATEAATGQHHATLLEGRCLPYGEANAWWPIAEALRQGFGIDPSDAAGAAEDKVRAATAEMIGPEGEGVEASRVADGLLYVLGFSGPLHDVEPSRARDEVIRSLQVILQAYARRHPLVVQLSEIHWADDLVLELLDRLLERARELPAVVLATARPELYERWTPKPGRYNLLVLNLDPLDPQSSERLLEQILGSDPGTELRKAVVERSGGNPLFLEELAVMLADADGGRPRAPGELPATLRGLVAARLDALDPHHRAAIEDAAVLGRKGSLRMLRALGEARGESNLGLALDALAEADLLVVSDGTYTFKSDIVREVAYETLTKGDRARRHAVMAERLEDYAASTGREDEFLERIAHHYGKAAELAAEVGAVQAVPDDVRERALGWLAKAAERAETRDTPAIAEPLYAQALRLVGPDDRPMRRRLLLGRAVARAAMRDLDAAREDALQAQDEAKLDGDLAGQARAWTVLGEVEQKEGRFEASESALERAVELWGRAGDPRGRADALRLWGMTMLHAGRSEEAEESISAALSAFRELGDRRGEAWGLQNLAWISFYQGDHELAEEHLLSAERLFAEIGDFGGQGWAIGLLGYVRYFKGDLEQAGAIAEASLAGTREIGDRWGHGMMLNLAAMVNLWQGHTRRAVERGAEAARLFEEIDDVMGIVQSKLPLGWGNAFLGRVDEALALAERGREVSEDVPQIRVTSLLASAQLLATVGDGVEAERFARQAVEVQRRIGESIRFKGPAPPAMQSAVSLGFALLLQGRGPEALVALEQGRDDAGDRGGDIAFASCVLALGYAYEGRAEDAIAAAARTIDGSAGTYLDRLRALVASGLASARLGKLADADAAFDDALRIVDGSEDLLHQALVRLAHGRALEALGTPAAAAALGEARERLGGLGLSAGGWEDVFRRAALG